MTEDTASVSLAHRYNKVRGYTLSMTIDDDSAIPEDIDWVEITATNSVGMKYFKMPHELADFFLSAHDNAPELLRTRKSLWASLAAQRMEIALFEEKFNSLVDSVEKLTVNSQETNTSIGNINNAFYRTENAIRDLNKSMQKIRDMANLITPSDGYPKY